MSRRALRPASTAALLLALALVSACGGEQEVKDLCADGSCPPVSAAELARMQREAVPVSGKVSKTAAQLDEGAPPAAYFSFVAQKSFKYRFACTPTSMDACHLRLVDAEGAVLGEVRGAEEQGFFVHHRASREGLLYFAVEGGPAGSGFTYDFEDLGFAEHAATGAARLE